MGLVSYTLSARTLHYQYVIVMDCNKDMLSAEENKRYWGSCYTTTTTKIPMRSFYTFLSDEELATLISDGIHEQMKRERDKKWSRWPGPVPCVCRICSIGLLRGTIYGEKTELSLLACGKGVKKVASCVSVLSLCLKKSAKGCFLGWGGCGKEVIMYIICNRMLNVK